jgi:hypothetical protein
MYTDRPMTRKEIDAMQADMQAEADLCTLVEAAKIRKDSSRYEAAMLVRKKKQEELERVATLVPAPGQPVKAK